MTPPIVWPTANLTPMSAPINTSDTLFKSIHIWAKILQKLRSLFQADYMKEIIFYFIKIGPLVRILGKHELFMDLGSKKTIDSRLAG